MLGAQCSRFEAAFAAWCDVRHALGVGNATDALEIALRAVGVGAGDDVITVANAGGYATTAILACGARPMYVDVDAATMNVDAGALTAIRAQRARAVLDVRGFARLESHGRFGGRRACAAGVHGVALGFKESAAVLPLQLTLVAVAWPTRPTRAQVIAVVACLALTALFFVVRARLFGNVWQVYHSADAAPLLERFRHATASVGPWWRALSQQTPGAASGYVGLLVAASATILLATRGLQRELAAALLAASAGLCAATLLNLGGLDPPGEGSRLLYAPFAWLALALGVGSAATATLVATWLCATSDSRCWPPRRSPARGCSNASCASHAMRRATCKRSPTRPASGRSHIHGLTLLIIAG